MSDHRLILGDCLDPMSGLAGLADKSVDHFIFDAPYSARIHANVGRETRNDGAAPREDLEFDSLTQETAYAVAAEVRRLCRRWVLAFGDEWTFGVWREVFTLVGLEYWRFGLWIKTDAMPQMSGDGPGTPAEHLAIAHGKEREGKKRWNRGGMPARWIGPCQERNVPRVHKTQKPEWLMEALVSDFTDPGELVLDPFAGSGTTGVACKRLGRNFIGYEKDPVFWAAAVKRIEAARRQYELLPRGPKPKQLRLGGDK